MPIEVLAIIRFQRIQRFIVNNSCGCVSLFETLRDLTSSGVDKLSFFSLEFRSLRSHSFWFDFPLSKGQRMSNCDWLTRSFLFFLDVHSFTSCLWVVIKRNEKEPSDLGTVRDEDFKNFYFGSVSFGKLSSCEESSSWNDLSRFHLCNSLSVFVCSFFLSILLKIIKSFYPFFDRHLNL